MEAAGERARPEAEAAVRDEGRREVLLGAVLSIAVLATAWCAYQATLWGGEMARDYQRAGAMRSESMRLSLRVGQFALSDVTIAADWLAAQLGGNQALAFELRSRMSPELDAAMDDWLRGWQPGQPLPPGHPFEAGRYAGRGAAEAEEHARQAEASAAEAQDANQRGDNYVLTGVLFALVLFFAGLSSKVVNPGISAGMVYGTAGLTVLGIVVLLVQPMLFAV